MSKNAFPTTVTIGGSVTFSFFSRTSVKRESGSCPTENHITNLTPLRFLRYFADDNPRFVARRVLKRDV
jgi:hypothetical protein